jgi:uncharacterized repeat protein (TIGR01451 family)
MFVRAGSAAVFAFFVAISAAAQADLFVVKTAPATATVGSTITYQVTIGNLGPQDAPSAKFIDTLPNNVTFASILQTSGPTFTCTTGGTVTCSIATLTNGTSATFDIGVTVQPAAAGTTIINSVTASSDLPDPNSNNNQYFAGTDVSAGDEADLFVSKSGPAGVAPDTNITYTIIVGNGGPNDATSGGFSDDLPAGTTFVSVSQVDGPTLTCSTPLAGANGNVSCTAAMFPAGASATINIVVHIDPSTPGGTVITNTATVASETLDPNEENDTSSIGTTISGGTAADVSILKSGPASTPPDTDVSYTITLTNAGPNDATNVSWTDTLPNSLPVGAPMTFVSLTQNSGPTFNCVPGTTTTCTIAAFPNGSSATFTLVGHVPSGTSGRTYSNVASVTSDDDPNSENDSSGTALTVSSADAGVAKSAPATALAGSTFNYVITLSNGGPDAATDVSFSDTLPAGITFVSLNQDTGPAATCNGGPIVACTVPLLGNGQSAQFTVTVQAASTVANGTVVNNTATVTSSSADTNPNNDSASASTTINAQADVAVVKSGPATAVNGTDVTYTITVTNNGPSTAANVVMTEGNPPNTTFVSATQNSGPAFTCNTDGTTGVTTCSIAALAPGATATFTIVIHLPSGGGATSMGNAALVSTSTFDPNSNNNTSSVTTIVSSQADVSVTKSAPAAASAGSNVTYTIVVTNAGPTDAANVTMSDTLPAGTTFVSESQTNGPAFTCTTGATVTCSIASLVAGASATFSVTVNIAAATPNGTVITNTATVGSSTPDPAPNNNTSSASTTTGVNADLGVTKSGPTFTPSNTNVVYTVIATNAGPSDAANVTLNETVPAGMTFVSANQTNGPVFNCSGTGPVVCTIATFAAGATATFQFTFNVPLSAAAGTQTSNAVTISSTTLDPNPSNNTASVSTTIGQSIPALSPLAMALLAMVLAAAGWVALRR